jgi:hypothetical protein
MNSGLRGRWDRNRTGNLRLWRPTLSCRVMSDAIAIGRSAPLSLSSYAAACRRMSAVTGANNGAYHLTHTRSPESCSRHRVSRFSACLLIRPSGEESINQRITNLLPSVRQRSSSIESTIFSGLRGGFRSSLSVTGCRCWGQMRGQSNLAFPSLTDTMRWIKSLPRGVMLVCTVY